MGVILSNGWNYGEWSFRPTQFKRTFSLFVHGAWSDVEWEKVIGVMGETECLPDGDGLNDRSPHNPLDTIAPAGVKRLFLES